MHELTDTDTVDEGTTSALATLQFDCVPATLQQLQTVVLQHLRANNAADGDGSFDSPAAQPPCDGALAKSSRFRCAI